MKKLNYLRIGLFLYLLVVGTIGSVYAQKVDSETALDIASSYLRQHRSNRAPARSNDSEKLSIAYTAKEAGETYYYAINNGTDNGFVIVSGHDATQEVLGYAEDGHFDYDSIPPQMRWLLGTYEKQIHAMYSDNDLANQSRAAKRVAKATRTNISNFVNITWNQYAPYNFGITGGKNSYPIGCVNTATSIIMKYYNHPAQATNPALGTLKIGSTTAKAIEANRKLSFSSMTASYSSSTTSYSGANKAVADLMYLVARLNETDFDTSGSGASPYTSAINMMEYFGYDKTIEELDREDFTATEWDNLMYAEIAAKRPVLYAGDDTAGKGGHAFLLTGYKDSKYYINWGWGGSSNGFFALNACNASGYKFNDYQYAITHIKKDAGGRPSITINSYDVKTKELGIGQALETSVNYSGHTINNPVYSWQIKLKNTKTGTIVPLYAKLDKSMSTYYEETTFRDTIPTSLVPGEQYEVLLYYHNGNGTWTQFAQTTKPIITIKHQIDFKSYEVKKTELSRGSTSPLAITFYKASSPIPVSYDLCAKITNLTQGTDTLIVLKTDYLPSYSSRDQTYSATIVFSESYHGGDKVKVEAGYRISGTSSWTYINQNPTEITLGNELDMLSYEIKSSGNQLPYAYIPYSFNFTCRSSLRRTIDFGIHYEGIDNSLDSIAVMNSNYGPSVGVNSSYSYSYKYLISTLVMHKRYRLTGLWRWNGEKEWHTFPSGTPVEITLQPTMTFSSFAMTKNELALAERDTISFNYSRLSSNSTQYYKLGLHVKGMTSKVDTVVAITNSYTGSVGDSQTYKAAFTVPHFLWLGEEVKLTGCYQEPQGQWIDIQQQPATFRVTNCYRFKSCRADNDSIYIGSSTTYRLKYSSLHAFSKPYYHIALKMHNLTTQMTDTICVLSTSFSDSYLTEEGTRSISFSTPSVFNDGDMIETTLLYKPKDMPDWITVENSKQTYRAVTIYYKSFNIANTDVSRGTNVSIDYGYSKPSYSKSLPYDLGVRLTNMTQNRDTMIVVKENYNASYYYSSTSGTFRIPDTFRIGDKCKVEACFRQSGKSEWEYIVQQPIELNLAPEMEMFAYNLKESGDLTYGYPLPYTLSYIRRSNLSSTYQIGVKYEGIDTPLDTMYVANSSFSGSTSQKEYSSTMSLPTFLKLNKNYRMSCKYRVQGEETWTDFAEGNTVNIHVLPAVTFHSFEHNKDELFACARDTMTFEYSKVSSGTSLSYTIGAHLIGQTSGIDTTIVATVNRYYSNFTGSTGEHLSSTITYNLPSTLYVGENVKVQLCWKEPGEAWVPMVKEYKTFKVLNCYELQSYSAEVDTAQIGSNATISVNYRALTSSSSKPTYWLGVKIRNLTTSSTEEYINTNYTLSWNASATDLSKTNVTFTMPSNCNVGDKVEVTALYRVGNMDKWIEVPGDPVIFEMKPPKNGVVLLGSPTVANEGYITPKNYEFHLVFKNYLNKELTRYIDVEIISNGSYKGDISHTFKIGANETKEIIITPNNSTDKILKNLPLNYSYNFRIYNGNNGGYYITSDKCPQLHLIPFGDVTQDGVTDLNDVEAVKLHLLNPASYPLDTISKIAADGNADGKVSIADLILIIDTVKE